MRRSMKLVMVVGVLLAVSASSSWALIETYLPGNVNITMKFVNYDVGTAYTIADPATPYTTAAAINALGGTAPDGAVAGEDSWGLLYLTEIYRDGIEDSAHLLWRANDIAFGDFEISGMFWGGVDNYLDQTTTGTKITQNIGASGFNVALWEDTATAFSAITGPTGRTNPAGLLPSYATATDGTLIWTLESIPGFLKAFDTSATRDFLADYTVDSFDGAVTGGGGFWSDTATIGWSGGMFTGSQNGLLGEVAPGVNLKTIFTNLTPPVGQGWDVKSNDPSDGVTTPELSSSVLMLLGLLPIGIGWRRRRGA